MNTRYMEEILTGSREYPFSLMIRTDNFIRESDLLILQETIISKNPCYVILVSKDWSRVLSYLRVIAIERLDRFHEFNDIDVQGYQYLQNSGFDAILTVDKSGPVYCNSIPELSFELPSYAKKKYMTLTIDNQAIERKIMKCINARYCDEDSNMVEHSKIVKERTFHIKTHALFKAVWPSLEKKESRFNLQELSCVIGVDHRRIRDFPKLMKHVDLENKVYVIINDTYKAEIEKVRKRARFYGNGPEGFTNRDICKLHKNWNMVLITDGFLKLEDYGKTWMVDKNTGEFVEWDGDPSAYDRLNC